MSKKDVLLFVILFVVGGFLMKGLPALVWEHDPLRLRYFVGIWFLAEAGFLLFPGAARQALPLYRLVWRYKSLRDRIAAALALAAFIVVLYVSVWQLTENVFAVGVKIGLAIATVLACWLVYYGICFLFGTDELRYGGALWFVRKWLRRDKTKDSDPK